MRLPLRPQPRLRPSLKRVGAAAAAVATATCVTVGVALQSNAAVPSGWVEVARDSYSRSLSGQWGAADLGGAYELTGSNSTVSTAGGAGVINLPVGDKFVATLADLSVADVDVSDTATVTGGSSYDIQHGWALRQQSDGSAYRARVRFSSNGSTTLGFARQNGSSTTWLDGVVLPTSLKTGDTFTGEFQVTGSSPVMVRARVWRAGTSKPGWQVTYADSSSSRIQSDGTVAVSDYVQIVQRHR